ncbi:c-type cytochrome biogenesis protein CcsB [Saccharomonospora azurea]|uniref:Cytochrome c-type biogenesis protein CcsB n=1 Tax=Saccharomonospora azurea NA-128 TaxID=882081 RepID=H8GEP6_9PSEU|nr:c-type cytochrome biogenesis protein CcsB [Saccharomonospora azurea]EHK86827.1 cytochrome c-type biogenesis protein CcsB [Saccharomonospora azurea SZMC 14600]EHY89957.1 cytochrome c-type biogenesis protein CcsB [Saccharomonospora azurea NA-128]
MPVNETLSQYSDWSYTTTVVVYVLAMIFFLVEQAFGKRGVRAAERTRERQLAGVGAGSASTTSSRESGTGASGSTTPPARTRIERIGRMGAALTILGAALHLAAFVLRGLATSRFPMGNMYEYIMAITLVTVIAWLVMMARHPIRHLSAFMLLPVVILMFVGGTMLYAVAAPVQPALQSYWLVIHVSAAAVGSGIFLVPGVASILYLIRSAYDRDPVKFGKLAPKLPSAEVLDRVAYRTTVFAFPVFTFGILCGAVWAEAAWGRFWGWDPKETVAFVAWVIYAAYLHSRATAGWRGTRAATINVVGFAATVFNLFFVNLVSTGLHSYAGVS